MPYFEQKYKQSKLSRANFQSEHNLLKLGNSPLQFGQKLNNVGSFVDQQNKNAKHPFNDSLMLIGTESSEIVLSSFSLSMVKIDIVKDVIMKQNFDYLYGQDPKLSKQEYALCIFKKMQGTHLKM